PARDEATALGYLERTRFGTLAPAEAARREVRLRHHVLRYEGPLFDALLARLAERPSTVEELARDTALRAFGREGIRDGVVRLLLGEQCAPMPERAEGVAALYNRAVLEQRLSTSSPVVLAAPVAGTGVVVPTLQAVALRLITGVDPAEHA